MFEDSGLIGMEERTVDKKALLARLEVLVREHVAFEEMAATEHNRLIQDVLYDIALGDLGRALLRATDNYEPPDAPGWEGGFASNH